MCGESDLSVTIRLIIEEMLPNLAAGPKPPDREQHLTDRERQNAHPRRKSPAADTGVARLEHQANDRDVDGAEQEQEA
jgi:hypothetical protein